MVLDAQRMGADGRPLSPKVLLNTGLHGALRRAGIRRVRFHDLSHSFGSNLIAAGVDVVTVSKLLGHTSPVVTIGV